MPILKPTLPVVLLMLTAAAAAQEKAFVGARIIDGTGKAAIEHATLLVHDDGRIEAVGPSVKIPAGAQRIDVTGKTIIPGLISGHSHVNDLGQLGLYARYGVTTVFSLGGDKEMALRDQTRAEQQTACAHACAPVHRGPDPHVQDRGGCPQSRGCDRRGEDRHRQVPPG